MNLGLSGKREYIPGNIYNITWVRKIINKRCKLKKKIIVQINLTDVNFRPNKHCVIENKTGFRPVSRLLKKIVFKPGFLFLWLEMEVM